MPSDYQFRILTDEKQLREARAELEETERQILRLNQNLESDQFDQSEKDFFRSERERFIKRAKATTAIVDKLAKQVDPEEGEYEITERESRRRRR